MSYQSRHVKMLKSDIFGKCGRIFILIGYDKVNNHNVIDFQV